MSQRRFRWISADVVSSSLCQCCLLCLTAAAVFTGFEGGWRKGSYRTGQETSYVGFVLKVMQHISFCLFFQICQSSQTFKSS